MNRPASLHHQVLATLSDGAARNVRTIAAHLAADVPDVREALEVLASAGLPLVRGSGDEFGLAAAFIALDRERIAQILDELGCKAEVEIETITASTNASLLLRARTIPEAFAPRQLFVLATELQTAGRGRQGRSWSAQAGSSLAVSFAVRLPRALAELAGLSLMCGLAAREALLRAGAPLQLKWPNDLLWSGRKLGGILIEVHPVGAQTCVAVIGIGINVAADPVRRSGLELLGGLPATDLVSAGALQPVDRNRVVADLADTLSVRLGQFVDAGFGPFTRDWNQHHAYRDRIVEMIERGRVVHAGIARGVDQQGRLCLDTESGPLALVAGDISLRAREPI